MCHSMYLVPLMNRKSLHVNLLSAMEANFHRPKHYRSTMHVLKMEQVLEALSMGLGMAIAPTCGVVPVTSMLCHGGYDGVYYCRGLPISSSHVLECSSHVEYKWVMMNVSMPHDKI
jgi:hypothetical protein